MCVRIIVLELAEYHSTSSYVGACDNKAHNTFLFGEESLLLSLSHEEEYKDKATDCLLYNGTENVALLIIRRSICRVVTSRGYLGSYWNR